MKRCRRSRTVGKGDMRYSTQSLKLRSWHPGGGGHLHGRLGVNRTGDPDMGVSKKSVSWTSTFVTMVLQEKERRSDVPYLVQICWTPPQHCSCTVRQKSTFLLPRLITMEPKRAKKQKSRTQSVKRRWVGDVPEA